MIKQIGKHRVMHSDVMKCKFEDLMQGNMVDVMYSDPPWGQGTLTYWQTLNKKMTGAEPNTIDYNAFINRIFSIAGEYVKKHLFIEYGQKWSKDIEMMGKQYGFKYFGKVELLYRSGSKMLPLDLHFFSKEHIEITDEYLKEVYHTYGYNTLKKALLPFVTKEDKILDPCCGMGYTAQIAVDTGATFFGNELNIKRLEKTIVRLEKSR